MKVYNCSDPGENPIPFWMTEKAYPAQEKKESTETMDTSVFQYKQDKFFPEFCHVRHA